MENLPIDIHTGKLLDWLVSRRHIKHNWSNDVLGIRKKINDAIKDMPEHEELRQLLSGTYINYWHCLRIVEILQETEADTKNLFGFYSSQRMKDWREIIKMYEKDNVYLGEGAQSIIRTVNYEVPALKRMVAKSKAVQEDCVRKEAEYKKNAKSLREQYKNSCNQIGIPGTNIKQELMDILADLTDLLNKVAESSQNLKEGCEFYTKFVKFMLNKDLEKELLPLLNFVMINGNTTTYEWVHGERPLTIEEPVLDIGIEEPVVSDNDTLDLDLDLDLDTGGDIDWGSSPDEIDWADEMEIVEKDEVVGIAKGNDALSILANVSTRSEFMDNLYELDGFLAQRIQEQKESGEFQLHSIPTDLQLSKSELQGMKNHVRATISLLDDVKTKHLLNIKSNPKYVHRLAESLQKKLTQADKCDISITVVHEKKEESERQEKEVYPKIQRLVHITKELQTQVRIYSVIERKDVSA